MGVEVFIEADWQDARATRDQRIIELHAEGYTCQADTLYRIHDGQCVFVLYAEASDETLKEPTDRRKRQPHSGSSPSNLESDDVSRDLPIDSNGGLEPKQKPITRRRR